MRDDTTSTATTETEETKRLKEHKQLKQAEKEELRSILQNKVFLRFLLRLLDKSHPGMIPWHSEVWMRERYLGESNIGNWVLAEIFSADPDAYNLLMSEMLKGKKDG